MKQRSNRDLSVEMVANLINVFTKRHEHGLHNRDNVETIHLLGQHKTIKIFKRSEPFELVKLNKLHWEDFSSFKTLIK